MLTELQTRVLDEKYTEPRQPGPHDWADGAYHCVRCDNLLFLTADRFECGCGWPAFDKCQKVEEVPDDDGERTEVLCGKCKGHLGHVFRGEHFTDTNTRYCINECILKFVANQ